MAIITTPINTENQMTTNYDFSKFLHGSNKYIDPSMTAAGGNGALLEGMVMGKIAATGLIVPQDPAAVDGSQYPVGLCVIDQTIADAATSAVRLVNKGVINEAMINFTGATTLDSTVGLANDKRSIRDLLNDLNLELRLAQELTNFDN